MSYRRKDKPRKSIRQTNKPFKGKSLEIKKKENKYNNQTETKKKIEGWKLLKMKIKKWKNTFPKKLNY